MNQIPNPLQPEPDEVSTAGALPEEVSAPDGSAVTETAPEGDVVASTRDIAEIDVAQAKQALEAALLSAADPLSTAELRRLFDPDLGAELVGRLLDDIQQDWQGRAVELHRVASGWRFQTQPALQPYLDRLRQTRAPRYSRAVLETLAIIVYRQPVTRGDIEEIRGVAVSANIIKLLETRGWIDTIGHRDTPGRPALYATTRKFLDDLGLRSLTELPPLSSLSDIEGVLDLVEPAEPAPPAASESERDE